MPSKIQRRPGGFLSTLGIKGTGQNPIDVLDDVRGTFDLTPHYISNDLEIVQESTAAPIQNVNDGINVEVPAFEAWRILALSGEGFNTTVGDVIKFFVGVRFSGQGQHVRVFNLPLTQTFANERFPIGGFVPYPIVLPGGSNVRAQLSITSAFTLDLRVTALIQRMRI